MKRLLYVVVLLVSLLVPQQSEAARFIEFDESLTNLIDSLTMKTVQPIYYPGDEVEFRYIATLADGREMNIPAQFAKVFFQHTATIRVDNRIFVKEGSNGSYSFGGSAFNHYTKTIVFILTEPEVVGTPSDEWYWKGDTLTGPYIGADHAMIEIKTNDGYEMIRQDISEQSSSTYILPMLPRDKGTLYLSFYANYGTQGERLAIEPSPLREPVVSGVKGGRLIGLAKGADRLNLYHDEKGSSLLATVKVDKQGNFSWPIGVHQQKVVYLVSHAGNRYESKVVRYFIDDRIELKNMRVIWGENRTRVLSGSLTQTDATMYLDVKFPNATYKVKPNGTKIYWTIPAKHQRETMTIQAKSGDGRQSKIVTIKQ